MVLSIVVKIKQISKPFHCTWQVVLPEKFCAKQMVLKNVISRVLGYAKKHNAKSYRVPLERAGAAQAKKPAKFGQNGLSVPATIS